MAWVAFDLEITKVVPDNVDLRDYLPLGISVAAVQREGEEAQAWFDSSYAPSMNLGQLYNLVGYLWGVHQKGDEIITWNGAAFDFLVLYHEIRSQLKSDDDPSMLAYIKELALNHYDVAFQMHCEKGYMCGLNKAARGMGFPGKPQGMYGALAPILWAQGYEQKQEVINYCKADVIALGQVYEAISTRGYLSWVSNAGNRQVWHCKREKREDGTPRLLQVLEAAPLPVTDWPTDQKPRSYFIGWAQEPESLAGKATPVEVEQDDKAPVEADDVPF